MPSVIVPTLPNALSVDKTSEHRTPSLAMPVVPPIRQGVKFQLSINESVSFASSFFFAFPTFRFLFFCVSNLLWLNQPLPSTPTPSSSLFIPCLYSGKVPQIFYSTSPTTSTPTHRTKTYGKRTFAFSTPTLLNSLPASLRSQTNPDLFKIYRKSYLISQSYL